MSQNSNALYLVTSLERKSLGQLIADEGGPLEDDGRPSYEISTQRSFRRMPELYDQQADLCLNFDAPPMGRPGWRFQFAEFESDLIVRILGAPDLVPMGLYSNEIMPIARWNWSTEGLVVNNQWRFWVGMPSTTLRAALVDAGIDYRADDLGDGAVLSPQTFSLRTRQRDDQPDSRGSGRPKVLWSDDGSLGPFEYLLDVNRIAYRLGRGSGVELAVTSTETRPDGFIDVAGLRSFLVELLVSSGDHEELFEGVVNQERLIVATVGLLLACGDSLDEEALAAIAPYRDDATLFASEVLSLGEP